ncbi:MAG TPA: glycosyltransferase [Opitutaceae bacterium]|nr:glycosyltransferase [Opitutaceae bacterium]
MSVFQWLRRDAGLDVHVFVASDLSQQRRKLGWRSDEYSELNWRVIPDDVGTVRQLVEERRRCVHLVNGYQRGRKMRAICELLIEKGIAFGGFSEAPLNFQKGVGRALKAVYLRSVLPWRVRHIVRRASFVVNLSGNDPAPMQKIGWCAEKIIPFGYFPERLPCELGAPAPTLCRERREEQLKVLVTGNLEWHRGHCVAIRAIHLCAKANVAVELRIAGDGPLAEDLRLLVERLGLAERVKFLGLVSLTALQDELGQADCVIGSGLVEPWGIRVNDAALLGKVCFVSDGMGVGAFMRTLEPRLVFNSGDYRALASMVIRFARDPEYRRSLERKAAELAQVFEPRFQANRLSAALRPFLGTGN